MFVIQVVQQSLTITAFVGAMMVAVEYVNVLTRGTWERRISTSRARQYLIAVLLGATPGCLGAFVVVTLYTHRMVSLGALTAAMIATSGDEAFVMLALFPRTAVLLTAGIMAVGWVTGALVDRLMPPAALQPGAHPLPLHEEETCHCFPWGQLLSQLRHPTPARGVLTVGMGLFALAVLVGSAGPTEWDWLRLTLLGVAAFGLFVVLTAPEHFLEEHLWRHTALQHVPRIFLWTLAAMTIVSLAEPHATGGSFAPGARWALLGTAALVGLVPDSGPHLVFVTLFARGLSPLSILVANSIVQDGHGMLPLLAHSRVDFVKVKAINLAAGLAVGGLLMGLGW